MGCIRAESSLPGAYRRPHWRVQPPVHNRFASLYGLWLAINTYNLKQFNCAAEADDVNAIKRTTTVTGSKKGLIKLSEDIATVNRGKQLAADVEKTASDLTQSDLRYTNAMRKGTPDEDVNTLRNDCLDKEEAHSAAKKP